MPVYTFNNPAPTDNLSTFGVLHSEQHSQANDAIEELGLLADAAIADLAAHVAAADPHPGYLTQAEADALYSVLAHTHTFASLTSTPTTLAGYGITDAQPLDADLTTWAGLTPSANAQSLVTAANYAAMRALLDLEAGTDFYSKAGADAAFQPLDSDLTSIAGLAIAGNSLKVLRVNVGETGYELAAAGGGGDAQTADPLSQFAATTSLQLKGVISDETGSGALVFADTPTLVTPVLGVATATSINGTTITTSTGTLTLSTFTLTAAANATVSGTNTGDQTTVSGNAGTATALQTARTIGGVSFDGTANIVPQTIQSVDESTDQSCFLLFITASGSQSLQPKNSTGLIFNSNTGALGCAALDIGGTTDTTLTRTGGGDLAIEGNAIYRAGGTDVPTADGGTGRSSHTAYAVLCGGTTTTAAQQSIGGVGTAGQVLTSNGAGALPDFQDSGAPIGYIYLEDQKSSGTDGGSSTSGSWETRTLNTEVYDTNNDCTLASNQFDLVAGTYIIEASAPAYDSSYHQIRLANIDDTTYTYGTSEFNVTNAQTRSHVHTKLTIAATKTFEIQHRVGTSEATLGYGVANSFGGNETYTQVKIIRLG